MVYNIGFTREKIIPSEDATDKKPCLSKTSVRSQKSTEESKRPKSSSVPEIANVKKQGRARSKTVEGNELKDKNRQQSPAKAEFSRPTSCDKCEKDDFPSKKTAVCAFSTNLKPLAPSVKVDGDMSVMDAVTREDTWESFPGRKIQRKNSEVLGTAKKRSKSARRPSEIPKLKMVVNKSCAASPRVVALVGTQQQSKLPIKTKESEGKRHDGKSPEQPKSKPESIRMALKSYRVKREAKLDEKIKEAMKDEFGFLVPLYESEFRKITEVWVNTLYCSLMMRSNLVKLMHQAFPQINRTQLQTEDDTLLKYIAHAKSQTKGYSDNLLHFIKAVQTNREKLKDQYTTGMANREIAQLYNHDWKYLTRRITDLTEETKQLQMEVPELQKKKQLYETSHSTKIREMETSIQKKDAQLQKVTAQLAALKAKETSYKKNIFLKLQDYKDVKADVVSLKSMEREYNDVKEKFASQNDVYEKKIRDLQFLLNEKKKILQKEKEVKQKLQVFLAHLQTLSVGKEQVDYVMGRRNTSKEKRREQLWMAAVKLVLKGFLIQMKKLEQDRNKMLLELQSNDPVNFNAVANSLVKRDNFIKTIKNQMNDFEKAFNCPTILTTENQCPVDVQC